MVPALLQAQPLVSRDPCRTMPQCWAGVHHLYSHFVSRFVATRAGSPALSGLSVAPALPCLSSAVNINDRGQVELSGCVNYSPVPREGRAQHGCTSVWRCSEQPRARAGFALDSGLWCWMGLEPQPPCRAAGTAHCAQINHGKTELPSKPSSRGWRAAPASLQRELCSSIKNAKPLVLTLITLTGL